MTLIVPTAYRRMGLRAENDRLRAQMLAGGPQVLLWCLRCCTRRAERGTRCNSCRADREAKNKGRIR